MNIETKTLIDGKIAYTFSRSNIDYTVIPQANAQFDVWKTNNQRGTVSVNCYQNGISFEGKKAPKFIIPILELIAA